MGWIGPRGGWVNGINAEDYGVKADGSDIRPALQALIDSINTNRKKPILLPAGVLHLGGPLVPKSDVSIIGVYGSGYGYTTLRPSGDWPAIQGGEWTGGSSFVRALFSDFQIDCAAMNGGTAYALDIRGASMVTFERIYVTSSAAPKTYNGLRLIDNDTVQFFDCEIMECRGRAFYIGALNGELRFYGCNFESDSGLAASPNIADANEWFGLTPESNPGRGLLFSGCQFERAGSVYINYLDAVLDMIGREQSNIVLGRRSRRCRIAATGNYPSTVIRDYGLQNDLGLVGASNIVLAGPRAPLLGEIADPYVTATKSTQRSVYGAEGQEFLLWHELHSTTLTATSQTVAVQTQPSNVTLETSDSHSFANRNAGTQSLDGKDAISWITCQTIAAGDDELRSVPSAGSTVMTAAWRNLLENGNLSDDSSGDPPTGWSKTGTFTGAYSSGWFQMTSPGSNIAIYQDLPLGAGQYMALARVKGSVDLVLGSAWNGTDGARIARDFTTGTGTTSTGDYFADGDTLLQLFFSSDGTGARISLGYLGTPTLTPQIRWVAVVRIDQTPKYYANNPPTSTSRYWRKGEIIYDASPDAAGNVGWICTTAGKPGTWKTFGAIAA